MSARRPGKMRLDALCGAISTAPSRTTACPICGQPRLKTRKWSTYCSDRCRKVAWQIKRGEQIPADIRATLNRCESKLDAIIQILKEGRP